MCAYGPARRSTRLPCPPGPQPGRPTGTASSRDRPASPALQACLQLVTGRLEEQGQPERSSSPSGAARLRRPRRVPWRRPLLEGGEKAREREACQRRAAARVRMSNECTGSLCPAWRLQAYCKRGARGTQAGPGVRAAGSLVKLRAESAGRRIGGRAGRRAGGSAGRRASGQAGRRVSGRQGRRAGGSAGRWAGGRANPRVGGRAGRRACESADRRRRAGVSAGGRVGESASGRVGERACRRVGGSASGRVGLQAACTRSPFQVGGAGSCATAGEQRGARRTQEDGNEGEAGGPCLAAWASAAAGQPGGRVPVTHRTTGSDHERPRPRDAPDRDIPTAACRWMQAHALPRPACRCTLPVQALPPSPVCPLRRPRPRG